MSYATAEHKEWISLIDVSGPFLTMPVLNEVLPNGLDQIPSEVTSGLRIAFAEKDESPLKDASVRKFISYVLESALEYDSDVLHPASSYENISLNLPEFQEEIRPDFVLASPAQISFSLDLDDESAGEDTPAEPVLLVSVVPGQELEKAVSGKSCSWSPARRMAELCRSTGIPLGLVCNGEKVMLVYAKKNKTTSYITWHISLWFEERVTLRAFITLLHKRRFFALTEEESLTSLMEKSADKQQDVTDKLGLQVRSAITEFLRSLDELDRANQGELLGHIPPKRLYDAALTVMMRLVFLLSAEERGLMRLGDEVYDSAYAASTLYESLREVADRAGDELLSTRHDAWVRLLSLFRAVYDGVSHDLFQLPAYGGSLFDPDVYPFLEGRAEGSCWRHEAARPLAVDNRVILHMLESVQFLHDKQTTGVSEAVKLSFRALDVEQIGHVYEGLLDRTACRASEVLLGFKFDKKVPEPWIPLAEVEKLLSEGEEAFFNGLSKKTGQSVANIKKAFSGEVRKGRKSKKQTEENEDPLAQKKALLRRVCDGDEALEQRVLPFLNLLRSDSFDRPLIAMENGLYVTAGSQRRDSGTHYTPRSITETLVTAALEPHVYEGPSQGLPREDWKLKSAEQLLDLKACDMAMGSGAFLVQVCRYLGEKLVEAWEQEKPSYELPADAEERMLMARRMVADSCLYGVDNNPMAVEMAKLSLWLTTMQKNRPFTFLDHALRCGDALMGVTHIEQLKAFDMKPVSNRQFIFGSADMEHAVAEALDARAGLKHLRSDSILNVERKTALLDKAEETTRKLRQRADALVMETVEGRGSVKGDHQEQLISTLLDFSSENPEALDEWLEQWRRDLINGSGKELSQKDEDSNPGFTRPFHWFLEFPEIFDRENPGFDVIIGNPPFKGSQIMREDLGNFYREYLVKVIGNGIRGQADLTAYFFLRAATLVRRSGDFGLISTNTIAQGDTRLVGLLQLEESGHIIRAAWPDVPWEGNATVTTSQIIIRCPSEKPYSGLISLSDEPIESISSFLKAGQEEWEVMPLKENEGIAFQGSIILGDGFLTTEEQARQWIEEDEANEQVLYPYLIGADVTSHPEQKPSRWVINFFDWEEEKAAEHVAPFTQVQEQVRPVRATNARKPRREQWWLFAERSSALYHAIGRGDRFNKISRGGRNHFLKKVLVVCGHSKHGIFSFVNNDSVFSHGLFIFASEDFTLFGIVSSILHHIWARKLSSTIGLGLRYTPSTAFITFPRPYGIALAPIRPIAEYLHELRASVMKEQWIGLTDLYNHIHDPKSDLPRVQELRDIHQKLDEAVAKAYGWDDLDMSHDFRRVDYLPANDNLRYTIAEPVRLEILQRLTLLNKKRYEQVQAEKATAEADPKPKKKKASKPAGPQQGSLI